MFVVLFQFFSDSKNDVFRLITDSKTGLLWFQWTHCSGRQVSRRAGR